MKKGGFSAALLFLPATIALSAAIARLDRAIQYSRDAHI